MEYVRPWIIRAIIDGPLHHPLPSSSTQSSVPGLPPPPLLPLQAFRTRQVQFIRFLSAHRIGTHQPIWAEVSDRQVSILIYLSSQIIQRFEADQLADPRPFSQLGYPTFSLGGCRWAWDRPSNKDTQGRFIFQPQLCLQPILDLPNKSFRIGSVAQAPFPPFLDPILGPPNPSRKLQSIHALLTNDPRWNLLIRSLRVIHDPRLSVLSSSPDQTLPATLAAPHHQSIIIPHPGPTKRTLKSRARRNQRRSKSSLQTFRPTHESILPTTSTSVTSPRRINPLVDRVRILPTTLQSTRQDRTPNSRPTSTELTDAELVDRSRDGNMHPSFEPRVSGLKSPIGPPLPDPELPNQLAPEQDDRETETTPDTIPNRTTPSRETCSGLLGRSDHEKHSRDPWKAPVTSTRGATDIIPRSNFLDRSEIGKESRNASRVLELWGRVPTQLPLPALSSRSGSILELLYPHQNVNKRSNTQAAWTQPTVSDRAVSDYRTFSSVKSTGTNHPVAPRSNSDLSASSVSIPCLPQQPEPDLTRSVSSSLVLGVEANPGANLSSLPRSIDENQITHEFTIKLPPVDQHLNRFPDLKSAIRVPPQPVRPSSHHRSIVLKIKGRRLSKYFGIKPIVYPSPIPSFSRPAP